jgi:hypothetical protein
MTTFTLQGAEHVKIDEAAITTVAQATADTMRALMRAFELSPAQMCVAGMIALAELAEQADGPTRSWLATNASLFDAEEGK